jgi:hypothetical protein
LTPEKLGIQDSQIVSDVLQLLEHVQELYGEALNDPNLSILDLEAKHELTRQIVLQVMQPSLTSSGHVPEEVSELDKVIICACSTQGGGEYLIRRVPWGVPGEVFQKTHRRRPCAKVPLTPLLTSLNLGQRVQRSEVISQQKKQTRTLYATRLQHRILDGEKKMFLIK